MKKGFVRPSQKGKEILGDGGVKVADISKPLEVSPNGEQFVRYEDAANATNLNIFKASITHKASTKSFLNMNRKEDIEMVLPLAVVRMLSLRFKLKEIRDSIITSIKFEMRKNLIDTSMLTSEEIDIAIGSAVKIINSVRVSNNSDKELLLILNKALVVKCLDGSDISALDLNEQTKTDPRYSINFDVVPPFIKALALGNFDIKVYGEDLVVVLDVNKVLANAVIPYIVNVDSALTLANYVRLGEVVYQNGYVNFALAVANVPEMDFQSQITVKRSNCVCARLQYTHKQLTDSLIGYNKPITDISAVSSVVFVRTADIASQLSGAEALKQQMTGKSMISSIPLINIPKETFTKSYKRTGNPLLDTLISDSAKADIVDTDRILKDFGPILDGKVYAFNIGLVPGTVAILPNFRKLVTLSVFGPKIFEETELPKIDIADNGASVAVAIVL